jgi:ribose/xylose/arabinose/galactoside ABC-type transport system permease subunit
MTDESATGGAAVVTNAPAAAPRGARLGRALHTDLSDLISRLSLLLFLAALGIYFGVSAEHFASTNNAWIILQAIAVIGIVSIGQTLVVIAGGIDLSVGAIVTVSAVGVPLATVAGDPTGGLAILIVLAVVAAAICRFTLFGRSLYSIGGNREASWLAGLRVDRVTILVYVISGTLAALAGVILTSQLLTGSTTVGTDSALTSIAAVVLGGGSLAGGVGTIGGTIVGVLILGVFQNGLQLMHVAPFYQQIATGAILLLAVAFSQLRQMDLGHRLRFARSRRP